MNDSPRLPDLKARIEQVLDHPEAAGIEPEDLDDLGPAEQAVADQAVAAFQAAGPELLGEATTHLWAYYRDVVSEFGPDERTAYGIPELVEGEIDIWGEVEVRSAFVSLGGREHAPAAAYVEVEGDVSWEREHGLMLVFLDGERLGKVGPYDGHPTNAAAHDRIDLLDVVFRGRDDD